MLQKEDINIIKKTKDSIKKKVIIIGISGASASGKSLLASTLVSELGSSKVKVISEDSYYKDQSHIPHHHREKVNYDHPNALDHELLTLHLESLMLNKTIHVPVYNYLNHTRSSDFIEIGPTNIIVLEGILLFVDKFLRNLMDIRIFVDTPLDLCIMRRIQRDVVERGRSLESVMTQYHDTVRPMFLEFIEPSKRYAHFIVPVGGRNRVAIDVIKARMRELLDGTARQNMNISSNENQPANNKKTNDRIQSHKQGESQDEWLECAANEAQSEVDKKYKNSKNLK